VSLLRRPRSRIEFDRETSSSILDYIDVPWPWLAGSVSGADRLVTVVHQLQSEPRWTVRVQDLRMGMHV
jgi:hypothetical protein